MLGLGGAFSVGRRRAEFEVIGSFAPVGFILAAKVAVVAVTSVEVTFSKLGSWAVLMSASLVWKLSPRLFSAEQAIMIASPRISAGRFGTDFAGQVKCAQAEEAW